MRIWVIYRSPVDYPKKHVVRGFMIRPGSVTADIAPLCVVDTLGQARARLPPGLCAIARDFEDEPHIVEVWL